MIINVLFTPRAGTPAKRTAVERGCKLKAAVTNSYTGNAKKEIVNSAKEIVGHLRDLNLSMLMERR